MIKVRVQNFQSIRDATVDIEGVTVVTGSNNAGKSALVRAIRGVFQNTPGVAFVRWGTESCKVSLEFDNADSLTWEKGEKIKPTYTLGDKVLHPGRGVPEELEQWGVKPLHAGNQDLWPQIAPQIQGQVFLLDLPGSVLAEAVADVERVGLLNESMREAEKDLRSTRATLKIRRGDLDEVADSLLDFEGLGKIEALYQELEQKQTALVKLHNACVVVDRLRTRKQETLAVIESLALPVSVDIPSSEALQRDAEVLLALQSLRARKELASERVAKWAGVAGVEAKIPEDGNLWKLDKALEILSTLRSRHDKAAARVAEILEDIQEAQVDLAKAQEELLEASKASEVRTCEKCGNLLYPHQ